YGKTRDELYLELKENKILSRRYFYPLITDFNIYNQYKTKTPTAEKISENVICLPIHHLLSNDDLNRIINVIKYDYK
ncbi:DegT/DnrJ/EryC1/StrS family aminotransferase, partial [Proteus mirabilis]